VVVVSKNLSSLTGLGGIVLPVDPALKRWAIFKAGMAGICVVGKLEPIKAPLGAKYSAPPGLGNFWFVVLRSCRSLS